MTNHTNLKSGRRSNRSETLVRDTRAANIKVKTSVRAGSFNLWKMEIEDLVFKK